MIFTKIDRIIIVTLTLFFIFFDIYENLYIIGYFTTNMKYINNQYMNIQVKGRLSMFYDLVLLKLSIILFTTDINCNRCIKNTSLKNI